ncbi:MAG: CDGSH iron-sulfur domain-containing protein [Fibrobacteria bacterium]
MSSKLSILKNGPLKIEGDFQLCDSAGKGFITEAGKPVFLCRCGQSKNKPFCDGGHRAAEFASEVVAP